jgi:hypothetical protein
MDTYRRTRPRLAAGLTAVVLASCATMPVLPAGNPADEPASEVAQADPGTGDWKDLITEEPTTGTSGDWKDELRCVQQAPSTAVPRAC